VHKTESKSWITDNALYIHEFFEQYDLNYLVQLLKSLNLNRYASQSGQPLISAGRLKDVEIPLPPLDQQRKIAAILDAAEVYRQKTKALITKYEELTQSLFLDMFGDPVSNIKGYFKSTVGEECDVKGGKRIPKGDKLIKEKTNHPYIKAQNIKNGFITEKNIEYLTDNLAEKLKRYIVKKGDVCITVVGVNIGDIGIVPETFHLANLTENANKLLIKNKDKLDDTYLAYYMMSDFVQRQVIKRTMAVGVPKLALFRIQQISLLLPPIEMQRSFKTSLNSIKSQKVQAQASLVQAEDLFNSLLQRAFKGELS
jgi:type I restriction enzyme S subunit